MCNSQRGANLSVSYTDAAVSRLKKRQQWRFVAFYSLKECKISFPELSWTSISIQIFMEGKGITHDHNALSLRRKSWAACRRFPGFTGHQARKIEEVGLLKARRSQATTGECQRETSAQNREQNCMEGITQQQYAWA